MALIKRVVLPSGKTIEVTYFAHGADAQVEYRAEGLHVCPGCGCRMVHPLNWREDTRTSWWVRLRCPECLEIWTGVFSDGAVDLFDEALERGSVELGKAYKRLVRANMCAEADRFALALEADAILPEDF